MLKLTKEQVRKIIKEEINNVIAEQSIEPNEKYDQAIINILEKYKVKNLKIGDEAKFRLMKGPFSIYFKTIKYPDHPARDLVNGYEVHEYSGPDYDEYIIKKEDEQFSI